MKKLILFLIYLFRRPFLYIYIWFLLLHFISKIRSGRCITYINKEISFFDKNENA